VNLENTIKENKIKQKSEMSLISYMLSLIHNLRFDREKKNHHHSFRTNLNNYSTSELTENQDSDGQLLPSNCQLLSSNWLTIYRKQ